MAKLADKVFVFGGSGRVGTELIKRLVAMGCDVKAAARHPERIVKMDHVETDTLDLHASVDQIAKQIEGYPIVYFVAGSRGKDLIQTDAMGAIKTMIASEKVGVRRYIMLSSALTSEFDKWSTFAGEEDYFAAKFFADTYLMDSTTLNYTILRPTSLTDEEGTGKIALNNQDSMENPIPDVAQVLADVLKFPATINKVIEMTSGSTKVDDALNSIH